ncbi:MAG: carbohydrate ABC transporter permease, partial [Lawsonibacter sp.]|nr:carbohydrate ABC transporter permease [Lawsonibacter sp.]
MTKQKDLSTGMSEKASDMILVAICAVVLVIVAYPLYYVLVASFSDPYQVYAGKTFLLPSGFTLDGYKAVFAEKNIVSGFLNSVKYTVIGTIFSVVMLYITAYPLAQKDLPGRKALSIFFLITMYFGGGLVPTYLVVKSTGLVGSMWSLFLPGGVAVGNMIIVRNYFQNSIPHDLIEASEIDGCSKLRTFFSVVIPLSMPIMA